MNPTVATVPIRCAPEALWTALTDTDAPRPWMAGGTVHSSWKRYAAYAVRAGGADLAEGHVVTVDPPRRLKVTFDPVWDSKAAKEPPGTLECQIQETADGECELSVTVTGLMGTSAARVEAEMPGICARLKSWLEAEPPR